MQQQQRLQYAPDGWLPEELRLLRNVQQNHPHLTVGVPPLRPWAEPCFFTSPTSPTCASKPGLAIEFTSAVCERLGLRCEMKALNWTTSSWNDQDRYATDPQSILQELILNSEFDTSLPLFAIDHTKMAAVASNRLAYTLPVFYAEDSILMKTPYVYPNDDTFLVKPFHPLVWLAILLSLMAVVFADAACRFVAVCSRRRRQQQQRGFEWRHLWSLYFREVEHTSIYQAGVLCQRNSSIDQPIVEWSRRLLVFAWGFSSVLLCTTYSACLVSRRMAPTIVRPFGDMEEFGEYLARRSGTIRMLAVSHDSYFFRDLDRWPDESKHLYETFRKTVAAQPPTFVRNLTLAMREIERSGGMGATDEVILYGSSITLRAIAGNDCNVSVIPLGKGQPLSYVFRAGSPHAALFTKVVLNFLDQGYYVERLQEKYSYGRRCENQADQGINAFQLEQQHQLNGTTLNRVHTMSLQLVFWALLCGYAIGGMTLMTEFLHKDVMCRTGVGDREDRGNEVIEITRF